MRRWAAIVIAGMLGGVILHILAVLAFPSLAGRNLWEAMEYLGPERMFHLVPASAPGVKPIAYLDPNMAHAVCRIDLTRGPSRIISQLDAVFWSVGVFNAHGLNLYSLNSRTSGRSDLDLLLIRSSELTPLGLNPPPILEQAVVADFTVNSVIVVLRAFVPDSTLVAEISDQLTQRIATHHSSWSRRKQSQNRATLCRLSRIDGQKSPRNRSGSYGVAPFASCGCWIAATGPANPVLSLDPNPGKIMIWQPSLRGPLLATAIAPWSEMIFSIVAPASQ